MYVVRRVWETKPGEARRVASIVAEIGNIYSRIMNPTQGVFEARMQALEGGTDTAVGIPGAAGNGSFDVVLGDGSILGLLDGRRQRRVPLDVRTAGPRGRLDALDELGEQLPAFGVLAPLSVLDVCPFRMSGHQRSSADSINMR